eukprot:2462775-Prymnesium_polylepis.1
MSTTCSRKPTISWYSLGVHVECTSRRAPSGCAAASSTVWMRCHTRSALSLGTHMMPRLG